MVPILELLFLFLLYGALFSCVLFFFLILLFVCFLFCSSLLLFVINVLDIYDKILLCSWLVDSLKANLRLGLALTLCLVLRRTIDGRKAKDSRYHTKKQIEQGELSKSIHSL